jgi:hypothetical protein
MYMNAATPMSNKPPTPPPTAPPITDALLVERGFCGEGFTTTLLGEVVGAGVGEDDWVSVLALDIEGDCDPDSDAVSEGVSLWVGDCVCVRDDDNDPVRELVSVGDRDAETEADSVGPGVGVRLNVADISSPAVHSNTEPSLVDEHTLEYCPHNWSKSL